MLLGGFWLPFYRQTFVSKFYGLDRAGAVSAVLTLGASSRVVQLSVAHRAGIGIFFDLLVGQQPDLFLELFDSVLLIFLMIGN